MSYDNEGRGVLFVNNKKEKDTHPDYTGKITLNGVEKRLSAWKKKGKERGTDFLSIQISDFSGGSSSTNTGSPTSSSIPREVPTPVSVGSSDNPLPF